jgi:hypothetical protein
MTPILTSIANGEYTVVNVIADKLCDNFVSKQTNIELLPGIATNIRVINSSLTP